MQTSHTRAELGYCYQLTTREPTWTVQTSADGHIVIAINARIENQIGVLCKEVTAAAGRAETTVLWPASGLGRIRAGARRATLLAREIGTTLLFIRSPPIALA